MADQEEDEQGQVADNSVGRLLTLSDGVFAIAMTLLALNLRVPALPDSVSDRTLRHALWVNRDDYFSYLISFYAVAGYWTRHHRLMRSVVGSHPKLTGDTLRLLLLIAALPFPAALLGRFGGVPFALALYGAVNLAILLQLLQLRRDVDHLGLSDRGAPAVSDDRAVFQQTVISVVVFALCIPAGYVLHGKGPYVLFLLLLRIVVSDVGSLRERFRERRRS